MPKHSTAAWPSTANSSLRGQIVKQGIQVQERTFARTWAGERTRPGYAPSTVPLGTPARQNTPRPAPGSEDSRICCSRNAQLDMMVRKNYLSNLLSVSLQ